MVGTLRSLKVMCLMHSATTVALSWCSWCKHVATGQDNVAWLSWCSLQA